MNNELLNDKKSGFGVFEAGLASLLFIVLNVLFMESYVAIVQGLGFLTSLGLLLAQFLVEALFGVAAVLVAVFCKKNLVKCAGLNQKINLTMLVYSALIAFCSLIFFASLTSSFMELLGLLGFKSSGASFKIDSFGSYIGYVIAACVTPAVCEELLFRGTIQSGLKKYGKWVSIVSASLIFMLMHGGPEQTVHQFIIGVVVGLMFYETGNLWLSIIVHFFNNFISVTELYIYNVLLSSGEAQTEVVELSMQEALASFAINLIIAIVMATIGFVLVRYLFRKLVEENEKVNGNKAKESKNVQPLLVDGQEILTEVEISEKLPEGEPKSVDAKPKMDVPTIVCFSLSIGWLVLQWFLALIEGFLR